MKQMHLQLEHSKELLQPWHQEAMKLFGREEKDTWSKRFSVNPGLEISREEDISLVAATNPRQGKASHAAHANKED